MDYRVGIDGAPESVPAGTSILLLHPSTGGTDTLDTGFLDAGGERYLVVSTRTTAREVQQKLEHYDIDPAQADILDTLSVERGYSRRGGSNLHYVSSPDDADGIIQVVEQFLEEVSGKRRVSFDSLSELAYYADQETAAETLERITGLLKDAGAIGLFHASPEVHDQAILDRFESACDGVIHVDDSGTVTSRF